VTARGKVKPDRRVQRTQGLLHQALVSLLAERPYDSITVSEILERAGVGRSTFYMHFRHKDELLIGGIRQILDSAYTAASSARSKDILGFSLPLFEHIQRHRRAPHVSAGAAGWAVVHEHMRNVVAEMIAADVRALAQHGKAGMRVPADLLVQHVASTFILVLRWWLERGGALGAREVNDLFRALLPRRVVP
jgi:AcrR family transcriptional regulator